MGRFGRMCSERVVVATALRLWWFTEAVRSDLKHPLRHVCGAAMPASWVLTALVLVSGLIVWLGVATSLGIWRGRLLVTEPPGP